MHCASFLPLQPQPLTVRSATSASPFPLLPSRTSRAIAVGRQLQPTSPRSAAHESGRDDPMSKVWSYLSQRRRPQTPSHQTLRRLDAQTLRRSDTESICDKRLWHVSDGDGAGRHSPVCTAMTCMQASVCISQPDVHTPEADGLCVSTFTHQSDLRLPSLWHTAMPIGPTSRNLIA